MAQKTPPEVKTTGRPLWIPSLSAASVVAILASLYFLLRIYAPPLSELLLSWNFEKAIVGAGILGIVAGLIGVVMKFGPLVPVRAALEERIYLVFERSRIALILAPVALVVALGTWWHWQTSARCPIVRIEPGGVFAYYLEDAGQAAKPPEKTFEIQVAVRDGTEVERFHPRDDGTIDIGASESVLRWRAAREPESKDAPKRSFLGTAHLHASGLVAVLVLCRKSGTELFHGQTRVSGEPALLERFPLKPEDDDEFSRRMAACDPIQP